MGAYLLSLQIILCSLQPAFQGFLVCMGLLQASSEVSHVLPQPQQHLVLLPASCLGTCKLLICSCQLLACTQVLVHAVLCDHVGGWQRVKALLGYSASIVCILSCSQHTELASSNLLVLQALAQLLCDSTIVLLEGHKISSAVQDFLLFFSKLGLPGFSLLVHLHGSSTSSGIHASPSHSLASFKRIAGIQNM